MPNDYEVARAARKGPQIRMGQGMKRVEPENKSKIVVETPGVKDETQQGAYHDRIKIEPKFGMKEPPPKKSDTEIQQHIATAQTNI